MRRRYVLVLALAIALIFALAGTAFGHYAWHHSKGQSGICIYITTLITRGPSTNDSDGKIFSGILNQYDNECR